jgi:hypothetical protein
MSKGRNGKIDPKVWFFACDSGRAYDITQTNEDIKDGDALVVLNEGIVGIMYKAWPTALTNEKGQFHQLGATWGGSPEEAEYVESVGRADWFIKVDWYQGVENGQDVDRVTKTLDRDKLIESGIFI